MAEEKYKGPERRAVPPLDEEEIKALRTKLQQERAMKALALKVRNFITFAVVLIGAFALFKDNGKQFLEWMLR